MNPKGKANQLKAEKMLFELTLSCLLRKMVKANTQMIKPYPIAAMTVMAITDSLVSHSLL